MMLTDEILEAAKQDRLVKCFYHSADLDGFCSGAIVGHALGWNNVEFFPINHGDDFPWDDINANDIVVMVDFSLQPYSNMRKLNALCTELIWLDHHKSAIDEDKKFEEENSVSGTQAQKIAGHRCLDKAGCELTWEWFFAKSSMPKAVYWLGRYDVWAWEYIPDCLEFQMGLQSYDCLNPIDWDKNEYEGQEFWANLFGASYGIDKDRIIEGGRFILKKQIKDFAVAAKSSVFETELFGYPMLAANVGFTNSQFFDSVLAEFPKAVAVMPFHYRKRLWHISMYQIKGRETPDLGVLAKYLGESFHGDTGGGHPGAAGFAWCSPALPFRVPIRMTNPYFPQAPNMLASLGVASSFPVPLDD